MMSGIIEINVERMLANFLAMVRIDSPSGDEGRMRDYLAAMIDDWGLPHQTDVGGNLIVDIPSQYCDHDAVLVLSGHMDVVPPCQGIEPVVTGQGDARVIQSNNTTVLGADDKAGLAVILEAVHTARLHQYPHPALKLIFTTREETLLGGAKDLDQSVLDACDFCVILDHTGEQGVIIHEAPSYMALELIANGKSAHAGMVPESGESAIVMLSKAIAQLSLGRIDAVTTANIGMIHGGKALNIIPDHAVAYGELRSLSPDSMAQWLAHAQQVVDEVVRQHPEGTLHLTHVQEFDHYRMDPEQIGVKLVQTAMQQASLTPCFVQSTGGSDNNVWVNRGLPGVVLSAGYVAPHTLKEQVQLSELVTCARMMTTLLMTFANTPFHQ